MFWNAVCEFFVSACWAVGAVIAFPVVLGCIMSLVAWMLFIAGYLMEIPFWIMDKIAPGGRHTNRKEV